MLTPVEGVDLSNGDLKQFPAVVQDRDGFAPYQAQIRLKHPRRQTARAVRRPYPGMEVVPRPGGETFRAVHTVRFRLTGDVPHAFRKKAKRGIATSKQEIDEE